MPNLPRHQKEKRGTAPRSIRLGRGEARNARGHPRLASRFPLFSRPSSREFGQIDLESTEKERPVVETERRFDPWSMERRRYATVARVGSEARDSCHLVL